MPFSESNASNNFTDQRQRFDKKQRKSFGSVPLKKKFQENQITSGNQSVSMGPANAGGSYLDYADLSQSIPNIVPSYNGVAESIPEQQTTAQELQTQYPYAAFDQNIPQFQETNGVEQFHESQPDIKTDLGYEIQKEILAENATHAKFTDEQIAQAIHATQAASEQGGVQPASPLDIEAQPGMFREEMDPFVQKNEADQFNPFKEDVEFSPNSDGLFSDKTIEFIDQIDNSKIETVIDGKQFRKSFDSDRKTFEKIIDHEKSDKEQYLKKTSPFKESNISFQQNQVHFTDKVSDSFRVEGKDSFGNDLFLSPIDSLKAGNKDMVAAGFIGTTGEEALAKRIDADKWESKNQNIQSKFTDETNKKGKTGTFSDGSEPAVFQKDYGKSSKTKSSREFRSDEKGFQNSSIKEGNNKHLKSVDSYFSDTKSSKAGSGKPSGKGSKGEGAKEGKSGGLLIAGAVLDAVKLNKKKLNEYISNVHDKKSSGDVLEDQTNSGLIGYYKDWISITGRFILGLLLPIIGIVLLVIAAIALVVVMIGIFISGVTTISLDDNVEVLYDEVIEGDGLTFTSLTEEQIQEIFDEITLSYGPLTYTQQQSLNYALHKVGCAYSQAYHGRQDVDIFDCSSLAYRAYQNVGIDISYFGTYTAAFECEGLEASGRMIYATSELIPGDLIFYGGATNGRHKGIYHVGIYVGNGKMVEAKGKNYGVVYGDVRTNNIVSLCRPG